MQAIELEEVQMVETSDETLEATVAVVGGVLIFTTPGCFTNSQ